MNIEVSTGEIFDKLTILELKLLNIPVDNETKLNNVKKEYIELENIYYITNYFENIELKGLVNQLFNINKQLWEIEDQLRIKEKNKEFDDKFIALARSVYFTNDKRAELKKKINELTKSELVEEKSYEKYD
jgi:hypothetical protein